VSKLFRFEYTNWRFWENLTAWNLEAMGREKATCLKKVLQTSRSSRGAWRTRLLKRPSSLKICGRNALSDHISIQISTREENIKEEGYLRQLLLHWTNGQTRLDMFKLGVETPITLMAVHVIHHKLCHTKKLHEPDMQCVYELCAKLFHLVIYGSVKTGGGLWLATVKKTKWTIVRYSFFL
jgi:hypothetical protein